MSRYRLDGTSFLACGCPHIVELILEPEERVGMTIWRHGRNMEAAMVVTEEMREQWAAEGKSGLSEMYAWIDRVHEHEGRTA